MKDPDKEQETVQIKIDAGTGMLIQTILEIERGEDVSVDETMEVISCALIHLRFIQDEDPECSNSSAS